VIVVCDSTILIGLAGIGRMDILRKVFSKIFIPEEVFHEVVEKGADKPSAKDIKNADWIEIIPVKDRTQVNLLTISLDKGEAQVLVLAKELLADLIMIDEEKARKTAVIAGYNIMGLLGLFILAKNLGLVPQIQPLIEELRRKRFRISDSLVSKALKRAGE
jgi:uncharacterized protein